MTYEQFEELLEQKKNEIDDDKAEAFTDAMKAKFQEYQTLKEKAEQVDYFKERAEQAERQAKALEVAEEVEELQESGKVNDKQVEQLKKLLVSLTNEQKEHFDELMENQPV
ncbi:hypothetical protein JF544_18810 [Halobacillus kuroshimensis]|uniref:Uncharacterized protein n=1 Tax=Halobacillus kuroshimensis TaxID=302481 RepID=A0ABS3E125_9BACI|nr:hypothetical protein [Halobacillus kuroshimensis]MBN8237299.1 hypothetical protein [Halobacillus kuroshimensis]